MRARKARSRRRNAGGRRERTRGARAGAGRSAEARRHRNASGASGTRGVGHDLDRRLSGRSRRSGSVTGALATIVRRDRTHPRTGRGAACEGARGSVVGSGGECGALRRSAAGEGQGVAGLAQAARRRFFAAGLCTVFDASSTARSAALTASESGNALARSGARMASSGPSSAASARIVRMRVALAEMCFA
jgi:hypothetical protein